MINRLLTAALLLPLAACSGQGSKKSASPAQAAGEEKSIVLGADDAKASDLDSEAAVSGDAIAPVSAPETKPAVEENLSKAVQSLDLSKAFDLIYSLNNGDEIKELAIQFTDLGCSIAGSQGIIKGSVLECAAIKAALLTLGDIPAKIGETPELPLGSSKLLDEVLKKLPI